MSGLSLSDHDAETLPPDPGSLPTALPEDHPTAAGLSMVRSRRDDVLTRGSLLGRYAVLDILGHGGMGVVYAAYDPDLDRRVAVKVLRTRGSDRERRAAGHARLLREAQAMARLVHPNVVHVYDVGSIDEAVFVAMEFIDGRTLKEEVAQRRAADGSNWRELLALYVAAGRGLQAAHDAGLVHRDFKPDNAMVTPDERVVVLDFGLAGAAGPSTVSADKLEVASAPSQSGRLGDPLTRTGAVLGTPAYMAPEQMMGQPVDARADQFSFCVALWEALYGERPFDGGTFQELRARVLSGEYRSPRGNLPGWVRRALEQGLQVDPDERFPSMHALLRALGNDPRRWRNRIAIGALGVGALAGAWLAGVRVGDDPDPCADAAASMAEAWTETRAESLRESFGAVGKAYAGDVAERVVPRLEAFARRWSEQRVDACRATKVSGAQSDLVLDLRNACLDRARGRFEATVSVLSDVDPRVASMAPQLVAKLPDLRTCADVELLRAEVPPPDDPVAREEVARMRRILAAEEARVMTGDLGGYGEAIDELLPRARELGYAPVEADLLFAQAMYQTNNGHPEVGRDLTWESTLRAEAAGDDWGVLRGLLRLVDLEGRRLSNLSRANEYLARANAVAERRGDRVADRIDCLRALADLRQVERKYEDVAAALEQARDLAAAEGMSYEPADISWMSDLAGAYYRLHRLDDAQRLADETLELGRELLGPGHPNNVNTLVVLGRIARERGDNDMALEYLQQARELLLAALGEQAPDLVSIDNAVGLTLKRMGRLEEARQTLEQGLAHVRVARGEESLDTAIFRNNLGLVLVRLGEAGAAVPEFEEALRVKTKVYGAEHQQIGLSLDVLGDALRRDGQLDRAEQVYREAIATFERAEPDAEYLQVFSLAGLGEIARAQGRIDEAVDLLERSLARMSSTDNEASTRAWVGFAAAQALWQQGNAGERAKALATSAMADYEQAGPEYAPQLDEIRRWLRKPG